MESLDFFPFVTPGNVDRVVFPDIDTRMKMKAPPPTTAAAPTAAAPPTTAAAAAAPPEQSFDAQKLKRSNQKASKTKDVYSLTELKTIAKSKGITFKGGVSKKDLINAIMQQSKIF